MLLEPLIILCFLFVPNELLKLSCPLLVLFEPSIAYVQAASTGRASTWLYAWRVAHPRGRPPVLSSGSKSSSKLVEILGVARLARCHRATSRIEPLSKATQCPRGDRAIIRS